ncbi:DUF5710 domain-containing protein [Streptomyces sp. NPDC051051]|uniref:DUF5710 domain-containing protein n=1 Tax=Streptomyces sp. NPDC051051 TaxID=3155666 RepID=UPI003432194A
MFFPADEVPAAVQWDIARAARALELYSPFLDRRPVRTWSAHLAKQVVDGVQVTVRIRDRQEQMTNGAAERVQGLVTELRSVTGGSSSGKEKAAWNPRTTGAGTTGGAGRTDKERLYPEVPYADKDEAKKRFGARWDPGRRKWYVDAAKVSREQAARWLPPTS